MCAPKGLGSVKTPAEACTCRAGLPGCASTSPPPALDGSPVKRAGTVTASGMSQQLLDEFVGRGDQRGVLHQPERPGELQPGPLMRLDLQVGQSVEGSCPDFCQVWISHLCAPLASPCREPGAHDPQNYPHVVHVASRLHAVTVAAGRITFHSLSRGGGTRAANAGVLVGSLG